ncbi:MAG: hypothetical protein HYX90_06455 [Chloroflexi bacterium]|nr:hypothetical protein [Chloroflexota bacterium]
MDVVLDDAFDFLLRQAGLSLPPGERAELKALYERYLPRLNALHAVDLGDEEVAGIFLPQATPHKPESP